MVNLLNFKHLRLRAIIGRLYKPKNKRPENGTISALQV